MNVDTYRLVVSEINMCNVIEMMYTFATKKQT